MHKPKFSFEAALIVVLFTGVGLACLREAFQRPDEWAHLVEAAIFLSAAGFAFIELADRYMFGSMPDREDC